MSKVWTLVVIFLVVAIIAGGITLGLRLPGNSPGQPIQITLPQPEARRGTVYIHGEVKNPGFFPLQVNDSLDSLLQAAGGPTAGANLSGLEIYLPGANETQSAQKVDINRAAVWLLDALPGIGEALAQRIVDYRTKNGPFRNIDELLKVPGIGTSVYDKIKNLITVSE